MLSDEFWWFICISAHQEKRKINIMSFFAGMKRHPITVWNCNIFHTFRCDVWITERPLNNFLCLCIFDLQNVNGVLQFSELRVLKRREKRNAIGRKLNQDGSLVRIIEDLLNFNKGKGCAVELMSPWKSHYRNLCPTVQSQLNYMTVFHFIDHIFAVKLSSIQISSIALNSAVYHNYNIIQMHRRSHTKVCRTQLVL